MITAGDFFNLAGERFALKTAAGKKGLNRPVVWLYLAEDWGSFGFIRGGELAITTGMSIKDSRELYSFISALIDKNATGLIINTGKYLNREHITEDITDLCNKNSFLLMTMPWEMHLSDLMQTFADMHFKSRLKEDNMKNALTELCRSPEAAEKHRDFLQSQQLMPTDSYAIGLMELRKDSRAEVFFHSLITGFKNIFIVEESPLLLLFHNMDREQIKAQSKLICRAAEEAAVDIHLATGSAGRGYESLCRSHAMAEKALKIARYRGINCFDYELSGIYQVFMDTEGTEGIKDFAYSMLGSLTEYDREHGGELVETLMAYIKYKGSLKAVAHSTSCHRNTAAYRIGKIKQLLDNDLSDGEYLAQLWAAAAAAEYVRAVER